MVKPENVVSVRSRRFSGYKEYTIKCEDCGSEFTRQVLNNRSNPYCAKCKKAREKIRAYEYQKQRMQKAFLEGYNAGFKDAVKAYQEKGELNE